MGRINPVVLELVRLAKEKGREERKRERACVGFRAGVDGRSVDTGGLVEGRIFQ